MEYRRWAESSAVQVMERRKGSTLRMKRQEMENPKGSHDKEYLAPGSQSSFRPQSCIYC